MKEASSRPWVVTLLARSAVRLKGLDKVRIAASPHTSVPVELVRIRNGTARFPDGDEFISGIIVEAKGVAANEAEAVSLLANAASPYLQVLAVVGNGAVDEPENVLAYAPPVGRKIGRFVQQKVTEARGPAATIRSVDASDLVEVLDALDRHPRNDRLHRAMAHYRMALLSIEHDNWVLAGESLFLATESLQRVIFLRLLQETGLEDTPEGKHRLALARGFSPPSKRSNQHLSQLDSHIRAHEIFSDDPVYAKLKFASDHFEHSSRDFGVIREAAAAAEHSFRFVRRAILRECGLRNDSSLFGEKFDAPLGGWRPAIEVRGSYTGSVTDPDDPAWPLFMGMNIHPLILGIEDADEKSRTLTLGLQGHGRSLLGSQTGKITSTVWILPGTKDHKLKQLGKPTVIVTHGDEAAIGDE